MLTARPVVTANVGLVISALEGTVGHVDVGGFAWPTDAPVSRIIWGRSLWSGSGSIAGRPQPCPVAVPEIALTVQTGAQGGAGVGEQHHELGQATGGRDGGRSLPRRRVFIENRGVVIVSPAGSQ